jgi:acetylornithine deacetylase/succinyl-diaminopimelate desuccinylase-like protein
LRVTFEKLHNAAFAGAADSADMRNAIAAAKAAGIYKEGPVRGWDVSCDARIFACEYPDLPVITTGPGLLRYAHSDQEQIDMREVARTCEFLAYYMLRQTGTE